MFQDGTIASQLNTLVLTVVLGMVTGAIYDLFRVIRVMCKIKKRALFALDLFFWVLATALVFSALMAGTWGEVRVYVFAGLGLGGAFYTVFLSSFFSTVYSHFFAAVARVVSFFLQPLWKLTLGLARFTQRAGKGFISVAGRVINKFRGRGK